jgi:hypothetical protein
VEFPEAFLLGDGRAGFDAVIGNPPFVGGKKISGPFGSDYRSFCVERLAAGRRGNADLCAYFILRGARVAKQTATLGLLATNSISQGDTREVGLEALIADGCSIYRATPTRPWPGAANLEIAELWVARKAWNAPRLLDGAEVVGINSYLRSSTESERPFPLAANNGGSFIGNYVLGMGFILQPSEAEELIRRNPRNADVVMPYLNGEDLNSSPTQCPSRYVINFRDSSEDVARTYPECWDIVERKVKPERQRRTDEGDYVLRSPLPQRYWQFAERQPALHARLAGRTHALVRARIANVHAVAWVPTTWVFNEKTVAFPDGEFAVIQSSIHEAWAREYASTLRRDMAYTPTECYQTFPLPPKRVGAADVEAEYCAERSVLMKANGYGLTKLYGRMNTASNRDAERLRELHIHLDRVVAASYGWTDLDLGHGFHETRQGVRFTMSERARREVLSRLLKLNHERHAEEVKRGDQSNGKTRGKSKGSGTKPPGGDGQGYLF